MAAQNESKPKVISIAAAEEINSTGLEFVARYYDALQGKPDAWPLERFYNKTSKHIHLRFGRRPEEALGLDQIKPFVSQMEFDRCTFAIDSIYARRPWPTRHTVFAVGRLSHPGRVGPRKFTQTTVFVKFPPSKSNAGRQYLILKTVFKFVDRVNDDRFFIAVDDQKNDGPTATTGDVPRQSLGQNSPPEKRTVIATTTSTTGGKRAGTSGQTTVVVLKNTRTLEPTKEELSDNLIPTPNEKSTAPKKISKNMRKKMKQLNESAMRAKQSINDAKPPQKCPKKPKTKYTKLCEITEGNSNKVSDTVDIVEMNKSLKTSGENLTEKQNIILEKNVTDKNLKVNAWNTRLSFTKKEPLAIVNDAPNDESVITANHMSIVPGKLLNVSGGKLVSKNMKEDMKIPCKKAQQAKQFTQNQTKTKQLCTEADVQDNWQIKLNRKKNVRFPRVTETTKDRSVGDHYTQKENGKSVPNLPSRILKGKLKTLKIAVLKNKIIYKNNNQKKRLKAIHLSLMDKNPKCKTISFNF